MNEDQLKISVIIGSIVGFIIAALSLGFMIKIIKIIFSFLFSTPLFTMKYIGDMTIFKIFLVLVVCFVIFGFISSLFEKPKKIKKPKKKRIK
tara:strand:- start:215 stop:490 length:276 start_codon:yes stop_codon:yes gene_type:complete